MEHASRKHSTINLVYFLYLVNLAVPFLGLAGLVLAYSERDRADYVARTHYDFQIRTFWRSLVIFIVGLITSPILIGIPILFFLFVWWAIRTVIGLRASMDGEAIQRPDTWLW